MADLRVDNESLYGSSVYRGGHFADDTDLPEYVQLCKRLFPTLAGSAADLDAADPEEEEDTARYFKYLTGLPLPSLKMEPTLVQSDLQRISNELTALLLNETATPTSSRQGPAKPGVRPLPAAVDSVQEAEGGHIFKVVLGTHQQAAATVDGLSQSLAQAQEILPGLEQACEAFTASMAELDRKSKVVQSVLDKQDLVSRIVELPRVMQMCVAGGYYEEAVEIAEHVRVTGDRLVQDISEDIQTLPGSKVESHLTPASKSQLVQFVSTIQKQVRTEFEGMVLLLCRELGYTHTPALASALGMSRSGTQRDDDGGTAGAQKSPVLGDSGTSGYERSMRRLSSVAKIVAILRSIGMFSESELRLLFLRARWQAWNQTADQLSGMAPQLTPAGTRDVSVSSFDQAFGQSSFAGSPPARARRGSGKDLSASETTAYLTKFIDAFCSWLAEVDMQYRTLFASKSPVAQAGGRTHDQFVDLAVHSMQQFLPSVLPLLELLEDASAIARLETLVVAHGRTLARSGIDFLTPCLMEVLHERAFASVVAGIEEAVAGVCQTLSALAKGSAESRWDQVATSTRPPLGHADTLDLKEGSDASQFLGQFRVSPVGLLQFPLLAKLLHAFRDALHALRILVMTGDGSDARGSQEPNEAVVLLSMVATVFESELIRVSQAVSELCASVVGSDHGGSETESRRQAARDLCVAFVFGLARNVSETFEEVSTLNDAVASLGFGGADSAVTLYSPAIYAPLTGHMGRPAST